MSQSTHLDALDGEKELDAEELSSCKEECNNSLREESVVADSP